MRSSWRLLAAALLIGSAVASSAGCFHSPDMSKLSCTTSTRCPSGWQCVVPPGQPSGLCEKAVDGGGPDVMVAVDLAKGVDATPAVDLAGAVEIGPPILDGPSVIDTSSSLDLRSPVDVNVAPDTNPDMPITIDLALDSSLDFQVALDGPIGAPDLASERGPDFAPDTPPDVPSDLAPDLPPPPPDLGPDLPPKKPLGASCTLASDCADNFCAGGVCCNRACTGACEECTAASSGQCAYKSGTLCSAASECMNAAVCSGTSGACPAALPKTAGTLCGAVTCAGNTQSASKCDGAGNCGAKTDTNCWPFKCVSGTGCKNACATSADCVAENAVFCGANGQCRTEIGCWRDLTTNLLWQADPDPYYHQLADAMTMCAGLSLCGFTDWVLPDIDQLRSLIRGCPNAQTGGACGVTTSCLVDSCESACTACENMLGPNSGCYDVAGLSGPCFLYWSSSTYYSDSRSTTRVRFVNFAAGGVAASDPTDSSYVRCVRP